MVEMLNGYSHEVFKCGADWNGMKSYRTIGLWCALSIDNDMMRTKGGVDHVHILRGGFGLYDKNGGKEVFVNKEKPKVVFLDEIGYCCKGDVLYSIPVFLFVEANN